MSDDPKPAATNANQNAREIMLFEDAGFRWSAQRLPEGTLRIKRKSDVDSGPARIVDLPLEAAEALEDAFDYGDLNAAPELRRDKAASSKPSARGVFGRDEYISGHVGKTAAKPVSPVSISGERAAFLEVENELVDISGLESLILNNIRFIREPAGEQPDKPSDLGAMAHQLRCMADQASVRGRDGWFYSLRRVAAFIERITKLVTCLCGRDVRFSHPDLQGQMRVLGLHVRQDGRVMVDVESEMPNGGFVRSAFPLPLEELEPVYEIRASSCGGGGTYP